MKNVLSALLVLATLPAHAEWREVAQGKDGSKKYLDPATMEKKGNIRRVSELEDYVTPTFGGLSVRVLVEYDCTEQTFHILKMTPYPDHMGKGKPSNAAAEEAPEHVRPGSMGEAAMKYVCAR